MKKIIILSIISILFLSSCAKKDFTIEKFKEIDILTINSEELTLFDYIATFNDGKPIILINYKIRHDYDKELIASLANDSIIADKFNVVALNTDKTDENPYDNALVGDDNFNQFIKLNKNLIDKGIIKYKLIFNPSGSYHDVFFDSWAADNQILVIKDGQVIYQNLLYENYPRSFEKKLVLDVLKSENKILQSEFTLDSVKISYCFNNFKKAGDWKVEYLNSNKKNKIFSEGNYDDGIYTSYFLEKMNIQATYKNGILNGEYKEFDLYNDGNIKEIKYYQNGKLEGVSKNYGSKGNVIYETTYKNDLKEGSYKRYYNNGDIYVKGHYANNKNDGEWISYYENDSIKTIENYKDGLLNGSYKLFYDNGQLKTEGNFTDGKLSGSMNYYYDNGNLGASVNYKNGELDGSFEEYFINKNLKYKGSYLNGNYDGEWENYWENGQLYKLIRWDNSKLIDVLSCYDENGNSLDRGTINNGEGTDKHYDKTGKLIRTRTYQNGKDSSVKTDEEKKEAFSKLIKSTKIAFKVPEKDHTQISYDEYTVKKYGVKHGTNYIVSVPFKMPDTGEVLLYYNSSIDSEYYIFANNKKYPLLLFDEFHKRNRVDFLISGESWHNKGGADFITQHTNDILIDEMRGKTCYLVYTISEESYKKYPNSSDLGFGLYNFNSNDELEDFNSYLEALAQ